MKRQNDEPEGCLAYLCLGIIMLVLFSLVSLCNKKGYVPPKPYQPKEKTTSTVTNSTSRPEHVTSRAEEVSTDIAYDEGYETGFTQGEHDGQKGLRHGASYDDSNDYTDYQNYLYCRGYEEGYDDGYDEGCSKSDEKDDEFEYNMQKRKREQINEFLRGKRK